MKVQRGTWQLEDGQFVGNECAWPSNGIVHGCKQRHVNEFVSEMARSLDSPILLTLDAHFVRPETKMVQDILLQNGNKNGWRASSAYYQMDTEQAWSAWSKNHGAMRDFSQVFQEAVENNTRFAEMIDKIEIEKKYHLPEVEFPIEIKGTEDEKLLALLMSRIRLHDRMPKDPELAEIYLARLQREISVIAYNGKINFLPYFLIIDTEICSFVRQRGHLMGPGRGSAAGCLLSYLLKITHIDPIVWNLSFERFLSLGRINRGKFPDIDLDFGDPKIVVDYLASKYQEKFARICTTGTAKLKGAIRDVSRIVLKTADNPALAQIVNDLCLTIENTPQGADIHKWLYGHEDNEGSHPGYIETHPELMSFFNSFPQVKEMVDQVLDVPRSVGRHASAYCISDEPIHSIVPMCKIKDEDCTQFTMGPVEALGLIKMDFLGLNTLNDIQGAIKIIKRRRNIDIDIYSMETGPRQVINSGDTIGININDPAVFKMFCDGETATVFQFKTGVATPLCRDIKPKNLHDLASITANGRPGTMYALMEDGVTTLIDEWKDRRMGLKKVTYLHPDLEPILKPTDGIYCMSLDSIVHDPETGGRVKISDFKKKRIVQSSSEQNEVCIGSVVEWVDSGLQDSLQVCLEDGRDIKVTHTTQFLTEYGWKKTSDLVVGDYVAIPPRLIPGKNSISRDRLRILAYLIAEGHLGSQSSVEFINSDERLLSSYEESVKKEFGLLTSRRESSTPGTWRVYASCGTSGRFAKNSLLDWLRSLGLKSPPGSKIGGSRSHEKVVPEEIFSLCPEDLAFFLSCYWDCDGGVNQYSWYVKTISKKLANDIQELLDRLGVQSWVSLAEEYESVRGSRKAWSVHVYTPEVMRDLIEPYCLIKGWGHQISPFCSSETVCRKIFVTEIKEALCALGLPLKRGCVLIGIDPQHCLPKKISEHPRIPAGIAKRTFGFVDLPKTGASSKLRWRKIISIDCVGKELMADLSVKDHHNFVANGMIVHNTFQEQIMASFVKCCGYSEEKADEIREIIGKKKADVMSKLLPEIRERLQIRGWQEDQIASFISLCVAASSYSFNASHSYCYAYIGYVCMWLKVNFKLEWWNSVLQNSNHDDLKDAARYVHDIVIPPDINRSSLDFYVIREEVAKLMFPLNRIKNVKGAGAFITEAREQVLLNESGNEYRPGPFKSIEDFYERINRTKINKRVVASLIWAGAFDDLYGIKPDNIVRRNDIYLAYLMAKKDKTLSTFVRLSENEVIRIQMELLAIGTVDVVTMIRNKTGVKQICATADVLKMAEKMPSGDFKGSHFIRVGGIATSIRVVKTKTGKNPGQEMAFVDLENNGAILGITVFPDAYAAFKGEISEGSILYIEGKLNRWKGTTNLTADKIINIREEIEKLQLDE